MEVPEKNIESKFKKITDAVVSIKDTVVSDVKNNLKFYSMMAVAAPTIVVALCYAVKDVNYVAENTFTDTVTVANTASTEQSMTVLDTEDRVISYHVNGLQTDKITSLDLRILIGGQVEFTGYVEQGDTTGTKIRATEMKPFKPVEPVNYATK